MRLSHFSFFVGALIPLLANDVVAQSGRVPSTECCLPLLIPIGARTIALGQALTAQPGYDAMFINPAGLMDLRNDQFVVHRSPGAEDAAVTTFSLLIHSRVIGVFGLTYRLFDAGVFEFTDDFGNPIGEARILDQVVVASFATRVTRGWTAGLNYKLYDVRGSECAGVCDEEQSISGTTHLIDGGVQFRPAKLDHLVLGASLMHFGLPFQVRNAAQADPVPARLRLGAAYEVGHHFQKDTTFQAWLNVDVIERARSPDAPAVNAGVEVILNRTFFVRAGHAPGALNDVTTAGTAIGIGLKHQRFDIAVAKTFNTAPLAAQSDPVHISFGVTF